MKIAKRVFLFLVVNVLIMLTISIVLNALGVRPYLDARGINYQSLLIFCALWGFGGAFISLALSRVMAKWMMGVKIVQPDDPNPELRALVGRVHDLAFKAELKAMPQVGYYESEELNAFATGPTQSRSLVAVSTGLLRNMNKAELDGVLAHEVAHIANGDMVTMTLVQGVVNAFVMFLARVAGFFASQLVSEDKRPMIQFVVVIALEILLGILGMIVVGSFSRAREFRADAGGASLSGRNNMIAALKRLKENMKVPQAEESAALATLKISGKAGGFLKLFSTHPDLDLRIARLEAR
ncbi:MAG: protease HtpX [Proteobacteria bacterium]|nr:protease HtpX [Pseudomonadota bacterium]